MGLPAEPFMLPIPLLAAAGPPAGDRVDHHVRLAGHGLAGHRIERPALREQVRAAEPCAALGHAKGRHQHDEREHRAACGAR
ncbi:MAG: hypothetical protein EXR71_17360 [Myxococcales bacterium]|nr:hypothetical protein [Myxococcales bacterium]